MLRQTRYKTRMDIFKMREKNKIYDIDQAENKAQIVK